LLSRGPVRDESPPAPQDNAPLGAARKWKPPAGYLPRASELKSSSTTGAALQPDVAEGVYEFEPDVWPYGWVSKKKSSV